MKTTFSSLAIGQEFDFNIDADGWELIYYKISDSEGYAFAGGRPGRRETFEPSTEVYTDGTIHRISPAVVTEVERAAITLLHDSSPTHPGLSEWLRAIGTDADEMRHLDAYIWQASVTVSWPERTLPLREFLTEQDYICGLTEWDHDHSAFGAILDHKPQGRYADNLDERHCIMEDDAVLRLAYAVMEYRVAGRPEGDQSHTIMGMGAPLLSVTTSLAAAIGEFVRRIRNNYATDREERLLSVATR
jgi:hypothetical protein